MTDEKIETEAIKAFGISEDGQNARMELSTKEDGGKVYLTMPVGNLPEFHRALGDLINSLRALKKLPPVNGMGSWAVGSHPDPAFRKFTALQFDKGTPHEALYMLGDVDALAIADAIELHIYKKLTPEEKITMDRARRKLQAPKIIMPGTQH
jgi:hypothetical protein